MCSPSATSDKPAAASARAEGFPSSRRVRKRTEFQRIYREGKRIQSPYFSAIFYSRDDDGEARAGFTVSRKVGKATVRNLAKRRLREAVRKSWACFPSGADVVFHARRLIREAEPTSLEAEVVRVLRTARKFRSPRREAS